MLSSVFGSSSLIQVTVVPAGTVIVFGTKTLFTICTVTPAGVGEGVGDGVGEGVGLGDGDGEGVGLGGAGVGDAILAATVASAGRVASGGRAAPWEPPELQPAASAITATDDRNTMRCRVCSSPAGRAPYGGRREQHRLATPPHVAAAMRQVPSVPR